MAGNQYNNILTTTLLSNLQLVEFKGSPAIEHFEILDTLVNENLGNDGASLFALPEQGFSKVRNADSITWYTSIPGVFQPLHTLSQKEKELAGALLNRQLEVLAGIDDPDANELLRLAINIPSEENIYFNGENVVLSNWGLIGDGKVAPNQPSALSSFLPVGLAPLLVVAGSSLANATEDDGSSHDDVSADLVNGDDDGEKANSNEEIDIQSDADADADADAETTSNPVPEHKANDANAEDNQTNSINHLVFVGERRNLLILLGTINLLLGLFLIYMLWPNNMVYPENTHAILDNEQILAVRRSANNVLKSNISTLRNGTGENICVAPDQIEIDRIAGLPVLPASPGTKITPTQIPSTVAPRTNDGVNEGEVTNPQPPITPSSQDTNGDGEVRNNADQTPTEPFQRQSQLLGKLDKGTVFVVGSSSDGISMGSGFFVAKDLVLTNYHVVENVTGNLLITNQFLDKPIAAKVIAHSPNSAISDDDFALLKLAREVDLPMLDISNSISRLDTVIAGGYPSFVISSDPSFARLFRNGDHSQFSNIQMAVTRGELTAIQRGKTGNSVLAHSATISRGNSGGPLIDVCGRIVGINTYVRTDIENALRLNFALSGTDILKFLKNNNVAISAKTGICASQITAIAPQPQNNNADNGVTPQQQQPAPPVTENNNLPPPPTPTTNVQPDAPPPTTQQENTPPRPAPGSVEDEANTLIMPDSALETGGNQQ